MGNMSYCRFQNTLADLIDCNEALADSEELSPDEQKAADRLVKLCRVIADDFGEDEE